MSMTRRQASIIIGLLFSMFLIIGIASYRESSQAQDAGPNRQLLPLVAGGGEVQSSDAEESPVADEHPEEGPPPELDVPVEEGPPAGELFTGEEIAAMREEALAIAANMELIPARGPETAGRTIELLGKTVELPDDVYIAGEVLSATCLRVEGHRCPEVPMIYLGYIDTDIVLGIGMVTGDIDDYAPTPEQSAANREAFQWLIDYLEITETEEGQ